MSQQHPELNVPPLHTVRVAVMEDNSTKHIHTMQTRATTESQIIKEALVWFAKQYGEQRADGCSAVVLNS